MLSVNAFAPMRMRHLDLEEPLPSLVPDPEGRALYVVFWSGEMPLGHQVLAPPQLPMGPERLADVAARAIAPAVGDRLFETGFEAPLPEAAARRPQGHQMGLADLSAVRRPLAALRERETPGDALAELRVSVVVCTRDRPGQLGRCLRSLLASSLPPHEIVVVDNEPETLATREVVQRFPAVRYVPEERPSLSVARNTGVRHCKGDVIAFTDDDAVVHPQWLASISRGFVEPSVMSTTGLVLPAELETEAQVVFELGLGGFNRGYRKLTYDPAFFARMRTRGVPVWRVGAGANMAVRRHAFDLVGEFDERLGAGAAGCSEDSELWYRILAAGYLCRYEPSAVVFHYHRSQLENVREQAYLYMRGHVAALFVQFARHRDLGNLRRAFLGLPWLFLRRVKFEVLYGVRARQPTLGSQISGFLAGFSYLSVLLHPASYKRRSGPR
jgi:glycosyltransferase involved in cell wall biosynthesis